MKKKADTEVRVKVEYPEPALSKEQEEELKKKLESALVLFCPELREKGDVVVVCGPHFRTP